MKGVSKQSGAITAITAFRFTSLAPKPRRGLSPAPSALQTLRAAHSTLEASANFLFLFSFARFVNVYPPIIRPVCATIRHSTVIRCPVTAGDSFMSFSVQRATVLLLPGDFRLRAASVAGVMLCEDSGVGKRSGRTGLGMSSRYGSVGLTALRYD